MRKTRLLTFINDGNRTVYSLFHSIHILVLNQVYVSIVTNNKNVNSPNRYQPERAQEKGTGGGNTDL